MHWMKKCPLVTERDAQRHRYPWYTPVTLYVRSLLFPYFQTRKEGILLKKKPFAGTQITLNLVNVYCTNKTTSPRWLKAVWGSPCSQRINQTINSKAQLNTRTHCLAIVVLQKLQCQEEKVFYSFVKGYDVKGALIGMENFTKMAKEIDFH